MRSDVYGTGQMKTLIIFITAKVDDQQFFLIQVFMKRFSFDKEW